MFLTSIWTLENQELIFGVYNKAWQDPQEKLWRDFHGPFTLKQSLSTGVSNSQEPQKDIQGVNP